MKKIFVVLALIVFCFALSACGGDKAAVVAFPKDTNSGYVWDTPSFDENYFKLTSQRSYSESAPGLPSTQYHEWTLTPLKSGTAQVVFTQYDSRENLEAKTDPFRKVTITYEIAENLTLKETDRIDLNYKQDE
ncbi:MAG: hypothetical protein E7588_06995 [Ruminococcaceae bacterium]|nr:hypothetical protein [Oscillospiraceae bacterium]